MALNTKSEFATKCGMIKNGKGDTQKLAVYIKRGKIIVTKKPGEDFIDDAIEQNALFLKEMQAKAAVKAKKSEPKPENLGQNIENSAEENESTSEKTNVSTDQSDQTKLTFNKIEADELKNQRAVLEIEKLNIEIAKKKGQVIPTDLAKTVIAQSNKSIVSAFKHAAEIFISESAVKYGIDRNALSEQRGRLIEIINSASDAALIDSENQIDNIVKEYSEVKGVGEKN